MSTTPRSGLHTPTKSVKWKYSAKHGTPAQNVSSASEGSEYDIYRNVNAKDKVIRDINKNDEKTPNTSLE